MNIELAKKIRRLAIIALASDDNLVETLILKGGNAIDLINNKSTTLSRASYDLDYSILSGDFLESVQISRRIENTLRLTFGENDYEVIDYKFINKPSTIHKDLADFWGGYLVEFKIIEKSFYEKHKSDIDKLRREAITVNPDRSTRIELEFSKFEYVGQKKEVDVDGYKIYVYTPEMIVFEKVRAVCQQLPMYREIIKSQTRSGRAKDFYDIFLIMQEHNIDPSISENLSLLSHIFEAKRVPLQFIKEIKNYKENFSTDWPQVVNTISARTELRDFDFYFDFVVNTFESLTIL